MSESQDVGKLLERAQHAEALAAAEVDAAGKAGWLRVAALSLLLAEQLLVEESDAQWRSTMTRQ